MSGIVSQLFTSSRFVFSSPISMLRVITFARHHLSWMFLDNLHDNAHSRETLDNLTILEQTATKTVTKVVTDTITMRSPTFYESVLYITQTRHFGIERPTTVYEAAATVYEATTCTVEHSILPTITVHSPRSKVGFTEAMLVVVLRIFWSISIAAIFFCLGCLCIWVANRLLFRYRGARPSRHGEHNVPANVAKGPEQILSEMNERAVPGPTIIRPFYRYSSPPKSIWS